MSKVDAFQQDAKAAMSWSRRSVGEKERQALIELARKWTQAALQDESPVAASSDPPEQKAPPLLIFYGPF